MLRALYLVPFATLLPAALRADSWLPPAPHAYLSDNSGIIVRVDPGSRNPDGSRAKPAHCRFFRYSEEKKTYEFWREHDLVNDTLPGRMVTPDDGSFLVTFDDYMGEGENTVVAYDSSGQILKKWTLNDIFSESEIEDLPHSTSSIHWRGSVGVMYSSPQHEVYISPPDFESDKNKYFKGFLLDMNTLTIREDPRWKRLAEWRRSEDQRLGGPDSIRSALRFWRLLAIAKGGILVAVGLAWALHKKRRTGRRS